MMISHALCMLVAPAIVHGAAFAWSLPDPTLSAPAVDNWSPAPTAPPQLPGFELFKRQQTAGGNTCGFVSGLSESSITCSNTNFICATNTQFGVHGCCDPASLTECAIPTTCIASTAMSSLCTNAACTSNDAIVKCTDSALPSCYRWLFVYSKTTMTQNGCAAQGFTSTALRSWGQLASSIPPEQHVTQTATSSPSSTPTLVQSEESPKPSIGVIVGGTVGGCVFFSIIAGIAFVLYRRRKTRRDSIKQPPITRFHDSHGITEYNPDGTLTFIGNDKKAWQQQPGPVHRESNAMPQYPGMGMGQYGVVEVDGLERPVEAPAGTIHLERPKHRA